MADSIYDFLTTEASSSITGGVNAAEGQAPSTVNNGIRAFKQRIAEFVDDLGAVNTVAGTADAITVTLASGFSALATGQLFRFKAGSTNTGAATLNVNAIGAKAIRRISGGTDVALNAGDIRAGRRHEVIYDAAANAAAGAWILLNPARLYSENDISLIGDVIFSITDENGTGIRFGNTAPAPDMVALRMGGADVAAFQSGVFTIGGTIDISGTTGGQIKFPATQNPSTDASTLDDYEEGQWTPSISFTTPGDLAVTYSAQVGTYSKIGRVTNISFSIVTSAFTHTTASGSLTISSLPFSSLNLAGIRWSGALAWSGITKANYTNIVSLLDPNSSLLTLSASGSGQAATSVVAADMPSGGTVVLRGSMTYET